MSLTFTGERFHPDVPGRIAIEHLHRYAFACDFVKGKIVADVASGEGYGSSLLATQASKVTGIDISPDAIAFAQKTYKKENVVFKVGSASDIPLENQSVEVVISFETIEHLSEHEKMIAEIKRILKPGGLVVISSPDKKFYSDITGYKNEFHVKELYFDEFKKLIENNFSNSEFLNQNFVIGSLIFSPDKIKSFVEYSGRLDNLVSSEKASYIYNIAVASEGKIPELSNSVYIGEELYQDWINQMVENKIRNVSDSIYNSKTYRAGNLLVSPFRFLKKIIKS